VGIAAFCKTCGKPLSANVQFCRGCGTPVQGATTELTTSTRPVEVTIGRSTNPVACPRCHEVDSVRKVSSLVGDSTRVGVIGGTFAGGSYQFGPNGGPSIGGGVLNAVTASQSTIGQLLSPPGRPILRSPWGFSSKAGILFLGFVVLSSFSHSSTVILGLVCIGLIALIVYRKNKETRALREAYVHDMPVWENAMRNWDRLHFCMRCDGIYYPGRPSIHRSSDMLNVIYQ